jgi:hypothetical protein
VERGERIAIGSIGIGVEPPEKAKQHGVPVV